IHPSRLERTKEILMQIGDINEKVGYLRSCVVGILVSEVARVFIDNEEAILSGEFEGALIDHIASPAREAYSKCSAVAYSKIYCAGDVVDVELAGNQIITFLMEKMIHAVLHPNLNYSKLLLSKFPQQYAVHADSAYEKIQAVVDHMSGMTDVYALDLYRKLNGMSLPAI
ncbi:MAG: dehydrogenase, partial [Muribaculaceae bacterium]|nr:dehydrogenase [Muribaculaceae bacterium]